MSAYLVRYMVNGSGEVACQRVVHAPCAGEVERLVKPPQGDQWLNVARLPMRQTEEHDFWDSVVQWF
jgi:hypothetical protein